MGKLEDIHLGIVLRIKLICNNTIKWCDKEIDKIIVKDPGLSKFR